MAKIQSKLSRGPKKVYHRTFQNNERKIHQALHGALRKRKINLTAKEIYQSAGITSPTFYLHCRNSNDALKRYERILESDLRKLIPDNAKKESVLTIFALYIIRNRQYFAAILEGSNYYLFERIINHYRNTLAENKTDAEFIIYTNALIGILVCWGRIEHFDEDAMSNYVTQMSRVR